MIIGFIPARGGSKGVPKKNLAKLGNRTLLEIGISKLLVSGCDPIFVSTDSSEIASLGRDLGAVIIPRPEEFSGDEASTESVIKHFFSVQELRRDDIVVMHQITSPFLKVSSIRACIEKLLIDSSLNSCFTVIERHAFIWENCYERGWEPRNHNRENRIRRQDLPERCIESGGAYCFRVEAFNLQGNRYASPTGCVGIDFLEYFEIDSLDELSQAKLIQEKMGNFYEA